MLRGEPASSQRQRPTIGLLIDVTAGRGGYQPAVWAGVADAAQEQDVNLLCFVGGVLPDLQALKVGENIIYGLANTNNVDGLIICGSTVASHVTPEEFASFCDRYRSVQMPIVTIGEKLPGIADVSVDNKKGMQDAVVHLIEVHGRHRIAFIRGPEGSLEAEQRYQAYQDALAEHGLPFDPSLVAAGDFFPASGAEAARLLVDAQKVRPDAIVAANDNMALGALEALQERGIRAPYDVALVGFDDMEEARAVTPPLTTVRQPMYEQGKRAVEILLALLEGKEVPDSEILPTELVRRRSCGCMESEVIRARAGVVTKSGRTVEEIFVVERAHILSEMVRAMGIPPAADLQEQAGLLLDVLPCKPKVESSDLFLSTLDGILHWAAAEGSDVAAWQGAVSVLRGAALACLDDNEVLARAEDLWHQARVMIAEMTQRAQAYRKWQAERRAVVLHEIGERLLTTIEVQSLMDVLAQEMPRLGIPDCYVCLYERGPMDVSEELPKLSRLMLRYEDRERLAVDRFGQVFETSHLIPGGTRGLEKRYSMVVEPLCLRDNQLGFALFEMEPREGVIYEALRGQISSALEGALLVQEVQKGKDYLQSLFQASGSFISLREPQMVLRDIFERIRGVMGACCADIVLVDKEEQLQRLAEGGLRSSVSTNTLMSSKNISLEVMRSNKPLLIEDLHDQIQRATLQIADEGIGAAACFPFCLSGKPIGVMWVYYQEPHLFSEAEVNALYLYINQAAVAVENAQLYDQVSCHAEELEQRVAQRTAELERARERAEAILNHSSDAVILAYADGTIQQVNLSFEMLFNYYNDEYFGLPLAALMAPESNEKLNDTLRAVINDRKIRRVEVVACRKDRSTFEAEIGLSLIAKSDEHRPAIVCSIRDITERKRAEQALREALQREKELSELKSRFVSMTSHEFRTPLATINAAADSLQHYRHKMSEQQIAERLQKIEKQIQHLAILLDDVLTIGQVQTGKIEFNPTALNLDQLCREIVNEFRDAAGMTHRLDYSSSHTGQCVQTMADEKLLRQIIGNLLSNAIKYSPPGSTVHLDLSCDSTTAVFRVADEGIGIPEEDQKHLFEAFHRANNIGNISGSGLGLTIAKHAVELHGGTIAFESQLSAGTTFTVTIPIMEDKRS